jgi:hypothetical protein
MKRVAIWLFYAVGALAIAYLALYAYVLFTGRRFEPGDPIHIFRKPDAPELGQYPAGDEKARAGTSPASASVAAIPPPGPADIRRPCWAA